MTDRHNRKQTMTLEDAAKELECGPNVLRQLIKAGRGPGVETGTGHYYIRIEWIERYKRGESLSIGPGALRTIKPIKKQARVSPFRIVDRKAS